MRTLGLSVLVFLISSAVVLGKASADVDSDADAGWIGTPPPKETARFGKIIGGDEPEPNSYPFIVALSQSAVATDIMICGGALLTPMHVLTARHCFEPTFLHEYLNNGPAIYQQRVPQPPARSSSEATTTFSSFLSGMLSRLLGKGPPPVSSDPGVQYAREKGGLIKFWFGAHRNLESKMKNFAKVQIAKADKVYFLKYDQNETHYDPDVILVRLDKRITLNEYVGTTCLSNDTLPPPGTRFQIGGWGKTSHGRGAQVSETLRVGTVRIKPRDDCRAAYRRRRALFQPFEFCAGHPEALVDSCMGDSGGPIFRRTSVTDEFVTIGTVARGRGCAIVGYPGIYTDLQPFMGLIRKFVAEDNETLCEVSPMDGLPQTTLTTTLSTKIPRVP